MYAPRDVDYEADNDWHCRSSSHVKRHVVPGVFRLSSRCSNRPALVVLRIDCLFSWACPEGCALTKQNFRVSPFAKSH
jgi:hypothetical protein